VSAWLTVFVDITTVGRRLDYVSDRAGLLRSERGPARGSCENHSPPHVEPVHPSLLHQQ